MPSETPVTINASEAFTPAQWDEVLAEQKSQPREPGYAPIYDDEHPFVEEPERTSTSAVVPIMIGAAAGLIVAIVATSR